MPTKMTLFSPWSGLLLFLIPGFTFALEGMKIYTTIYARYAVTTVNASFVTGDTSEIVNFEMNIIPEAFVSGFSVTADGLKCDTKIEEYSTTKHEVFSLSKDGDMQKFETKVKIQANKKGYFLLRYEHPVLKNDILNNYNVKIPIKTSQFYEDWIVTIDIKEDYKISKLKHHMEISSNSMSHEFRNIVNIEQQNHIVVTFTGSLKTLANAGSVYTGYVSVNYTTDHGIRHMETFVSETQIAAVISQNAILHSELSGGNYVVLLDNSGSMNGHKLDTAKHSLSHDLILKMPKKSRVTLITFNDMPTNLGTFSGEKDGKIDALTKIDNIATTGYTDIGAALHKALEVAKNVSTQYGEPAVINFLTDADPTIGANKTLLEYQAKQNNSGLGCTEIHSFPVGKDADAELLKAISDGCGTAYKYDISRTPQENFKKYFKSATALVYAKDLTIGVSSNCVHDILIRNDLMELNGTKYAHTGIELIDIPLNTKNIQEKPCGVKITYRSSVESKAIVEELKICLLKDDNGKLRYMKLKLLTPPCPENSESYVAIPGQGEFLERLRQYKDIVKEETRHQGLKAHVDSGIAVAANFFVENVTVIVAAKSNSNECNEEILCHHNNCINMQ